MPKKRGGILIPFGNVFNPEKGVLVLVEWYQARPNRYE
jgi:hypothetical protein